MRESCSLHFLHGLGAVAGQRCQPLRCAASCELRAAAPRCSGLVAPSGTRGMGNPAAVKRFRRVPVGGRATGRCGGHAQVSRQAKNYAHKGIITLVSCDKAFQDPCHSETREQKYVQQHIRICTHGVEPGLG